MRLIQTVSACVLALSSLVSAESFTNPIKSFNGADPHISFHDGYYYMMTTSWTDLKIAKAKTLNGLKNVQAQTVWKDSTANRCCNMWAAELHNLNGKYNIFYSAGVADTKPGLSNYTLQRPHVLQGGATPFDKYEYGGQLSDFWGIDGTVVRFDEFGNYFCWSCMQKNEPQSLCIAKLGQDPGKILEPKVISRPTLHWEMQGVPVMEGPAALYHNKKVYLSYSASFCATASYNLGLLTWNGGDPTLASSWRKSQTAMASANGNYGPGHNCFFDSPDHKETWIAYHATNLQKGDCHYNRYTMAQKVGWNTDGTPLIGPPVQVGTLLQGPSGE